jgi:glycerol-1-phosphate dehydrogenase [NAD(P)+]
VINSTQIVIPTLVRIKPGALDRLCLYADRAGLKRVVVLASKGLAAAIGKDPGQLLKSSAAEVVLNVEVSDNSFELATELFRNLPGRVDAVIGIGGGKALDVAKYIAFLGRLRYYAVPTSLSNDGFCSPQSSLTIGGKRKSLPAALPHGVVVDTAVCLSAPTALWLSGVGDLVAKVTAVADWKLAFHAVGTPGKRLRRVAQRRDRLPVHGQPDAGPGGDPAARDRAHAERDRHGDRRLLPAGERRRAPDFPRPR